MKREQPNIRIFGILITIIELCLCGSAYASNVYVGGPNETLYFAPNMGGTTVTLFPTFEGLRHIKAGPSDTHPGHMVPDPLGEYVFSINHGRNQMSVYDAKTGRFIRHIKTGNANSHHGQGHQYGWSTDGSRFWLTEVDDGALVEIARNPLRVSRKIAGIADDPQGMVIAEKEGFIYVLEEGGSSVTQVRIADFKVVKHITVGKTPHAGAYAAGHVYIGNTAKGERSVSVIDASTGKVIKTIDVGFENPHFLEDPANGAKFLIVESVISPNMVLIDPNTNNIVGRFNGKSLGVPIKKVRHPMYSGSGRFIYLPLGRKNGTSRLYRLSVPDLKVVSKSPSAPSMIHMMQVNKAGTRIYAATEGDAAHGVPFGVTVYKINQDESLKKIADMYADIPAGETMKSHHGSLN